jgi:hypothetical protein
MSSQTENPACTTTASQDANPSPNNFAVSTIVSLFSSSGQSGDWLKLFIVGGILELLRRCLMYIWKTLVNQFWITLALEEYNDSYCESRILCFTPSCEPNASRRHSLDDGLVISTTQLDAGKGVVDQQPLVWSRMPRLSRRGRSGR